MSEFTAACVQLRSGRDVLSNLEVARQLARDAVKGSGAGFVQTPEMSNLLVRSRDELFEKIVAQDEDPFLAGLSDLARELGIWLHIGSMAVRVGEDQAANRGYMIGPDGRILARYDKIHMFDVDLPDGESWRESATYRPGSAAMIVDTPLARFGMGICYDVRFPQVFRNQAVAGAMVLTAPAAFTQQTGKAHWHVLQRARAIENGAFMISAAQSGRHEDGRETYGHSLIVSPWGKVLCEMSEDEVGYVSATICLKEAENARKSVPVLKNEREFALEMQNIQGS
ncbi:nitrilase and fragile histidine triad fusion protein NitFhit [Roseibium sp. TrichSKD4]|uniref:carbon-nitrogen hydrolase family protein n=1 Tax=Roseibium sp. TrichSKD4 TaxID=744980 RepID=UPI0001E5659F|nr:carbon-nitrogen hydrolase family protein [Roseibium sp. TrichSKD4]EFO33514.1 nitrilase and fragile histidine triad fusion protein NitFhit [Roseibium sp. TrichSKD4]